MNLENNLRPNEYTQQDLYDENKDNRVSLSSENLLETPFKEVQNFGSDQMIKLNTSKNYQMKLSTKKTPSHLFEEDEPSNKENIPMLVTSKKLGKFSTDKLIDPQMHSVETRKNDLVDILFSTTSKNSIISKDFMDPLVNISHIVQEKDFTPEQVARDLNEEIEGVASHKKEPLPKIEIENNQLPGLTEEEYMRMMDFSSNKKSSDEYLLQGVPSRIGSVVDSQYKSPDNLKTPSRAEIPTSEESLDSQKTLKKNEAKINDELSLLKKHVPMKIVDGHIQFSISMGGDFTDLLKTLQSLSDKGVTVSGNPTTLNDLQGTEEKKILSELDPKSKKIGPKSRRVSSYRKQRSSQKKTEKLQKTKSMNDAIISDLFGEDPSKNKVLENSEINIESSGVFNSEQGCQSPLSFLYDKKIRYSEVLQTTISSSVHALEESIENASSKFQEMKYVKFDYEKWKSELTPFKNSPCKKLNNIFSSMSSVDSKCLSVDRSMVIEASTPSSSNVSKHSSNRFASDLLQAILSKQKLPTQEISLDQIRYTLAKQFSTNDYDLNMTECIQAILAKKSCIYRSYSSNSKRLIYQVSALLGQGLVLYIHTTSSQILSHLQDPLDSLSWACLTGLLNREKTNEILELVRMNQVKILYVTADKFLSENLSDFPELAFICIDEAQCLPSNSSNYKNIYTSIHKHIKANFKNIPVLSIASPTSFETIDSLRNIMSLESSMIFPKEYISNFGFDITISCDDDKVKALINFLKRKKNAEDSLILYTESKKSIEDISNKLLQNGFKAYALSNAKNETQRLEILSLFTKTNGGILVTSSNCEFGIDKSFIKGVIHFSMSKSLEIYIQEVSFLKEGGFSHVFLNDEDYYRTRQAQSSNLIEIYQINKIIQKIIDAKVRESGALKKKSMAQETGSALLMRILKGKDESQIQYENEALKEYVLWLKVAELSAELDLSKDCLVSIFEKISEKNNWFDYIGLSPIMCNLKVLNPNILSLKSKSEHNYLIKHILEKGKKVNNIYKLHIVELANEMKKSTNEIMKVLKSLQSDGLVSFEVSDEALCFKINFEPNNFLLDTSVEAVYAEIHKIDALNLARLDVAYAIMKKSSFQNIEHINKGEVKPVKLLPGMKQPIQKQPIISGDKNSGQKKLKACFTEFIDRYMNDSNSSGGYDSLFDGFNQKIRELVPLSKLQTLKEKNNIITDITPFLGEFFQSVNLDKFGDANIRNFTLARNIVKVLQGLQNYSGGKEWKSNKFWEKYYRCDYKELFDVVHESLVKRLGDI